MRRYGINHGVKYQEENLNVALSLHPQMLLLVDEPTSSQMMQLQHQKLQTLLESNCTVVIVSHSKQQLKRLCTKTIELS